MPNQEYILIVDDEPINRRILKKMLLQSYQILEAKDGEQALSVLTQYAKNTAAVMLDLHMPVMDGYQVLAQMKKTKTMQNIPVIVTTGSSDTESEIRALGLGAWDFVSKPYNPQIIQFRLRNAIQRSELEAFAKLKYMSEHDMLTGLWNRSKFFEGTKAMLQQHKDKRFTFVRFDLERFKLINSFFGTQEGDQLLLFLSDEIRHLTADYELCTYGRMESDVFCLCLMQSEHRIDEMIANLTDKLAEYNPNYNMVPCFGLCEIEDSTLPVESIFMRSTLAAKACKGNHVKHYMYYTDRLSERLSMEQEITNEMNTAIEQNQFEVYFQPKYALDTNLPYGAEALVRWKHPKKGMISPGVFIPVFEKNGFITKLDYYVWEYVCRYIRDVIRAEKPVYPISVNISRVDLYNPNLADIIISLVEKYEVPVHLLNLELTESAYSDNPMQMSLTMKQLQDYGFIIMMDDFGSGYSSLNVLKDIAVDVLKIDMRFFSKTEIEGRGENIIASVIRMAKWLNIPVIAEGVETREQVEFLRSIGCDYVQGFYFARPMPIEDYVLLCDTQMPVLVKEKKTSQKRVDMDSFFATNPQMELLFGNMLQPIAICEYGNGTFEVLRVNDAYQELFGYNDLMVRSANPLLLIDEKYRGVVIRAFETAAETDRITSCEYERDCEGARRRWLSIKIRHINEMGDKHVMFVDVTDITEQKKMDFELNKYRTAIACAMNQTYKMLIVDDEEVSRVILNEMFAEQYDILEAEDGEMALELLKKESVDIILLDLYMPKLDGREFLKEKNEDSDLSEIPVVIITAETSEEEQVKFLSYGGVSDYILKPFVKESVLKRVSNVAQSSHHMKEVLL